MGIVLGTYFIFAVFSPILFSVSLLEFCFLCMLLLGICVASNVKKKCHGYQGKYGRVTKKKTRKH